MRRFARVILVVHDEGPEASGREQVALRSEIKKFLSFSVIFCHFLSCSVIFYHVLSCSIIFYRFLSFSIIFYNFLSFSINFYQVSPCRPVARWHTSNALWKSEQPPSEQASKYMAISEIFHDRLGFSTNSPPHSSQSRRFARQGRKGQRDWRGAAPRAW